MAIKHFQKPGLLLPLLWQYCSFKNLPFLATSLYWGNNAAMLLQHFHFGNYLMGSKVVHVLQIFVCLSGVSYVVFALSLFVPHLSFLARQDYVPGELMLSPSRWHRHLSVSVSALAQCLSFHEQISGWAIVITLCPLSLVHRQQLVC